jgi:hypothetical protein
MCAPIVPLSMGVGESRRRSIDGIAFVIMTLSSASRPKIPRQGARCRDAPQAYFTASTEWNAGLRAP